MGMNGKYLGFIYFFLILDNFWMNLVITHFDFWGISGISNIPKIFLFPGENPQNGTQPDTSYMYKYAAKKRLVIIIQCTWYFK